MEGRWAQLTIDAHIAHAIDYRRPVKPFIEDAILDRMETLRELQVSQLYPTLSETGGQVLLTKTWAEDFTAAHLTPWKNQIIATGTPVTIQDRIKKLNAVQSRKR